MMIIIEVVDVISNVYQLRFVLMTLLNDGGCDDWYDCDDCCGGDADDDNHYFIISVI